jgi:mannose-1-phosphate guanylyltransferase
MSGTQFYAVVMAGGRGERFWPLGRRRRPKQLLKLTGEKSMLEDTVLRLFPLFAPENILIITSTDYVAAARELLPIPEENIVGEPVGRDTAPCVALALGELRRRGAPADAVAAVLPADHLIAPAVKFQKQLNDAMEFAFRRDVLMTLGITPTYPATGYGYINAGDELAPNFRSVKRFVEKPPRPDAERYLAEGGYFWNSGIFVWKLATLEKALDEFVPELGEFARRLAGAPQRDEFLVKAFPSLDRAPIDRAVMEKADNTVVSPVRFEWDDLGSWSALRSRLAPGSDGNCGRGPRIMLDCRNNIVISRDDHLVGAIGVEDLAIIHTEDATLVCPLGSDQRIKELLARIAELPDGQKYL